MRSYGTCSYILWVSADSQPGDSSDLVLSVLQVVPRGGRRTHGVQTTGGPKKLSESGKRYLCSTWSGQFTIGKGHPCLALGALLQSFPQPSCALPRSTWRSCCRFIIKLGAWHSCGAKASLYHWQTNRHKQRDDRHKAAHRVVVQTISSGCVVAAAGKAEGDRDSTGGDVAAGGCPGAGEGTPADGPGKRHEHNAGSTCTSSRWSLRGEHHGLKHKRMAPVQNCSR